MNSKLKCIEFMGMPKSGKSTQLEILKTRLEKEKGARVREIYEGARISPLNKADNRFLYNAWSFHNTLNRLLEARLDGYDYLLIDRGVYDHLAFTEALHESKQITDKQYIAQLEYFKQFTDLEDVVLMFLINPAEAMHRENKHHNFIGRVMNEDFLSKLKEAYTLYSFYADRIIDCSKSLEENSKDIFDAVLGDKHGKRD